MNDLWMGLGELAREGWASLLHGNLELIAWMLSLRALAVACIAALALMAAVVGARRPMIRVVAAAAGMALGFSYAAHFEPWLPFLHLSLAGLGWDLALAFGVLGALTPEGFSFLLVGYTMGSGLAGLFKSGERAYAFIPGFLLGGAAGVMGFPLIAAVVSSFGGGWICAAALAALFPKETLGGVLQHHPLWVLALGLAIGVAGFIGQLSGVHLGRLTAPGEGETPPVASPARRARSKAVRVRG